MVDLVCPLRLALYGHPDAGGYWDKQCDGSLQSLGFHPIDEWKSCATHARLKLCVVVYVDDFKLAGPKGNIQKGWGLIHTNTTLDALATSVVFSVASTVSSRKSLPSPAT